MTTSTSRRAARRGAPPRSAHQPRARRAHSRLHVPIAARALLLAAKGGGRAPPPAPTHDARAPPRALRPPPRRALGDGGGGGGGGQPRGLVALTQGSQVEPPSPGVGMPIGVGARPQRQAASSPQPATAPRIAAAAHEKAAIAAEAATAAVNAAAAVQQQQMEESESPSAVDDACLTCGAALCSERQRTQDNPRGISTRPSRCVSQPHRPLSLPRRIWRAHSPLRLDPRRA